MLKRVTNILGALMLVLGLGIVGLGLYMMFFVEPTAPVETVVPLAKPIVKPTSSSNAAAKLPQPQ